MDLTPAPAHTCLDQPAPAMHLCSVPTASLPELVEHHPVVDLDRYEFGRRQVGRLLTARQEADGSVVGTIELRWSRADRSAPGRMRHGVSASAFRLERDRGRVTVHLPTDVLESLPGAFDVEFG